MFDADYSLFIYPKRGRTVVVFVKLFMSTIIVPAHNKSSQIFLMHNFFSFLIINFNNTIIVHDNNS